MSRVTMVVVNDIHYTVNAPECRADTYAVEILSKLHEVARLAKRLGAQAIGCTGDWYHRKGRTLFRESNDVLAVLHGWREKGLDVVGILGNHDIAGHSLDSLDNRAVGSLVHSRVLHLLDHEPYKISNEGSSMAVTGTSYFHGCDSSDEGRLRMYGAPYPCRPRAWNPADPDPVHVHFAHGTLLQRGEFFEDYTVAGDLVELLAEHDRLADVIVCGHLHFPEGVRLYDRPGVPGRKVAVCRVGSLARVASDDFDRLPSALVIAAKGASFLCKPVPIGAEVKRGEEREDARDPAEHEARIKEFVRVLREEADDWSLVEHGPLLRQVAEGMGFGEDVLERAIGAVERRQ